METVRLAQQSDVAERAEPSEDVRNGAALLGIIIVAICSGVVGIVIGFALGKLV